VDEAEPVEYWQKDIDERGYDRMVKYLQASGEYAILHGSNSRNHLCMNFDCETWNNPEDIARLDEEDEEEPDWKAEYGKAISALASVRNSYAAALRSLWGGHPGDTPDADHFTLGYSEAVIKRGIKLLDWGDDGT
jgi:hypothetical protein